VRRATTVTILALIAVLSAILLAGPSNAAGPGTTGGLVAKGKTTSAGSSVLVETLVRYLPRRRLPVRRRIAYRGVCTADCNITARSTLVLPGPNIGPVSVSGSFGANEVFESFLKLNRPALAALKRHRRKARLRTRIFAVDLTTGDTDTDRRTFRFKHG
jgi:hypothetical protein